MPDYENETCEGCILLNAGDKCPRADHGATPMKLVYTGELACDDFVPSLACRQIRALEKIVKHGTRYIFMPGPCEP